MQIASACPKLCLPTTCSAENGEQWKPEWDTYLTTQASSPLTLTVFKQQRACKCDSADHTCMLNDSFIEHLGS